jgi:hypothetical protein
MLWLMLCREATPSDPIEPNDFVLLLRQAASTLEASWSGPYLFVGVHADTGLAGLQTGSDPMLAACGRGHVRFKVKPHLLRKYYFPFQLVRRARAHDPALVAALL